MKKVGMFLISFVFVSMVLLAQEESLVLHAPACDIYGTLRVPEVSAPMPVVLIIAGSGPTDRNGNQPKMQNNSLKMLAESLNSHGIATLNFDKRAIAKSTIPDFKEENLSFDDYVNDVRLWIDLLAKDSRFSSVIVAGHSEGSLIGMIASENHAKVNSCISIAGSALPADEILKEQLAGQPQQAKDMIFPFIDQLKRGELIPDVPQTLYMLFRPSIQPYMISWMKYNPQTEIRKLTVPILIVQGTTDIQIASRHADLLAAANPKAEKVFIEKMNHVLKTCDSMEQIAQTSVYTNPELPVKKELIEAIVKFIK